MSAGAGAESDRPADRRSTGVRRAHRYPPPMGLNPFREQRKTAFDVAMVVGAVVVTIGIVLWAMFGG